MTTVVHISQRGGEASCVLSGELVVPRMVERNGRHVEVALVAGRAMLLPGDDVRLHITVGEGCTLRLVDIGGLVVYGRPGAREDGSRWHARIAVGVGGRLVWDGLPTVVTDAGRLTRSLELRLERASSATLRETLVLGRTGERGGRLTSETDVADAAGQILRETLEVSGGDPIPGVVGEQRVIDSIMAFGDGADLPETPGVVRLELARAGAVLRYLGSAAHESPLNAHAANAVLPEARPPEARPALVG